jgi:ADP-ribosylglycohydrolase
MSDERQALERAQLSLSGLSVGDAFGQALAFSYAGPALEDELPPGPWSWTDDTHMALSIVEVLRDHGAIHQEELVRAFVRRFSRDPGRGYGAGAYRLLKRIANGEDWRDVAPVLFPGGSMGNGAAMRAGPIGGYFVGDPERAAAEAKRSAEVTHAHPEGQAGAMAVAAAAAIAGRGQVRDAEEFLREVMKYVPEGDTRVGLLRSLDFGDDDAEEAAEVLGTGLDITAPDTVPYCLWCAARNPNDFRAALWLTVRPPGDRDTTCAIVGSIVALSSRSVPQEWESQREALPSLG